MGRGPRAPVWIRLSVLLLLSFAPATPASARDAASAQEQVRAAERARAAELANQRKAAVRARSAAEEEQRLAEQRVAAAARLHQAEIATAEAAQRMEQLTAQRREVAARLAARAADMAPLLPLIERLRLYPAETLLATPADPETALTGVAVLRGLARRLERDAALLRREQVELDKASQAVAEQTPVLNAALAAQADLATELDRQIAAASSGKQQALDEAEAAGRRAAELAEKAESLRAVIAAVEAERRAAQARARREAAIAKRKKRSSEAAAARQREAELGEPSGSGTIASSAKPGGQLRVPVVGRIGRGWGDRTDAGPATGITYLAPPAARVVSPCSGRVVFAAPFRSFGRLLIVNCGGGYHAVLAGLDRLDAKVSESVQAGEPVGVMPNWDPKSEAPSSGRPGLYVELRHRGRPVDPAPWLKARS